MCVEPVTLVVTALVAGATAGISGTMATAVADAYEALKKLVAGCLRRGGMSDDAGQELVAGAANEAGPRAVLLQKLAEVQVDEPTTQAAQRMLLELLESAGRGKFHVELRDNTGVQVGDYNEQTININPR